VPASVFRSFVKSWLVEEWDVGRWEDRIDVTGLREEKREKEEQKGN
jgi:hypothetical protein